MNDRGDDRTLGVDCHARGVRKFDARRRHMPFLATHGSASGR
jgi:hypothetical protein